MNRRDLLTATPAALVGIAAPALAAPSLAGSDGLTALHRRFLDWQAAYRAADAPGLGEAEADVLFAAASSICREIMEMPSQSVTDYALKMCCYTSYGFFCAPEEKDSPTFASETQIIIKGGKLPADPARAHVAPDADLLASYARWVALRSEWLRLIDLDWQGRDPMDVPEVAGVDAEANALFDLMLTMKPQTQQGFAVYVALIWEEAGPVWKRGTSEFEAAAQSPEYAPILALWRHIGTRERYPDQWRLKAQGGAA